LKIRERESSDALCCARCLRRPCRAGIRGFHDQTICAGYETSLTVEKENARQGCRASRSFHGEVRAAIRRGETLSIIPNHPHHVAHRIDAAQRCSPLR
jgi:hypothetical protein